jgi:hypothetical protein
MFPTAVIAGALCITSTAAPSARADDVDTVTISLSPISAAAGSTVGVNATITNSGPDTLNLDDDNLSVSDPLSVNDEFLANAPYTLDPGSVTFELFQITIAPGATLGIYGTDGSDIFSFFGDFNGVSLEDDVPFTVDVTGAIAATPEPGTLWLVCLGLGIVAWFRPRRDPRASD